MTTRRTKHASILNLAIVLGIIGGCVLPRPTGLRSNASVPNALHQAGVYATSQDYETGRLVNAVDCRSASQPPDRKAFRNADVIEIPSASGPTRIPKAAIYGFHACDGDDVRFVSGGDYRIVRAPPMYLYQHERRVLKGKAAHVLIDFAFSITAGDTVRPLTKLALKTAYPENHKFHDLLDLAFRKDDELVQYDDFHNEYRVARVLRQAQP